MNLIILFFALPLIFIILAFVFLLAMLISWNRQKDDYINANHNIISRRKKRFTNDNNKYI